MSGCKYSFPTIEFSLTTSVDIEHVYTKTETEIAEAISYLPRVTVAMQLGASMGYIIQDFLAAFYCSKECLVQLGRSIDAIGRHFQLSLQISNKFCTLHRCQYIQTVIDYKPYHFKPWRYFSVVAAVTNPVLQASSGLESRNWRTFMVALAP